MAITNRRLLVWAMKYIPALGTIVYTFNVGLRLFGHNWRLAENLVGLSLNATILLWLLSKEFHFCRLHKCLIAFTALVDTCMMLREMGIINLLTTPIRIALFVIGLILIAWLFIKRKDFFNHECR